MNNRYNIRRHEQSNLNEYGNLSKILVQSEKPTGQQPIAQQKEHPQTNQRPMVPNFSPPPVPALNFHYDDESVYEYADNFLNSLKRH